MATRLVCPWTALLAAALVFVADIPPEAAMRGARKGGRTGSDVPASVDVPLPPPRPSEAGAMPRQPETPGETQQPEVPGPASPAPAPPPSAANPADAAPTPDCRSQLTAKGAEIETAALDAQPDPRCTVDEPVRLLSLQSPDGQRIALPDRPVVACAMASVFADFVAGLMVPLAKGTFGKGITSVGTGPGLECRPRNHVAGAKLSAHGRGLALDVAQLRLDGGTTFLVGNGQGRTEAAFDRAVRAAACGYFHTILGPGSDPEHATHWHMDLETRGRNGDAKFCQ